MWKRAGLMLGAVAASFMVTGAGEYHPTTQAPENTAAAHAVEAITAGGARSLAAIPADFADVMGYQPSLVTDSVGTARAVKPGGSCSSPVGFLDLSPFELECKAHDLGYDLLRYAAASGGELGPWARKTIDDQFTAAIDDRAGVLGGASSQAKVWLADAGVRFNSWRQGQGVPVGENGWPYAFAGLLVGAALAGPPIASWAGRRRRPAAATARPSAVVAAQ